MKQKYYLKRDLVFYGVISVFGKELVLTTLKKDEALLYYPEEIDKAVQYLATQGITVVQIPKDTK